MIEKDHNETLKLERKCFSNLIQRRVHYAWVNGKS